MYLKYLKAFKKRRRRIEDHAMINTPVGGKPASHFIAHCPWINNTAASSRPGLQPAAKHTRWHYVFEEGARWKPPEGKQSEEMMEMMEIHPRLTPLLFTNDILNSCHCINTQGWFAMETDAGWRTHKSKSTQRILRSRKKKKRKKKKKWLSFQCGDDMRGKGRKCEILILISCLSLSGLIFSLKTTMKIRGTAPPPSLRHQIIKLYLFLVTR